MLVWEFVPIKQHNILHCFQNSNFEEMISFFIYIINLYQISKENVNDDGPIWITPSPTMYEVSHYLITLYTQDVWPLLVKSSA